MSNGNAKTDLFGALGAVIAATSSAVGLGNIWKFPTMTGQNGGASFIIVYIISSFFVGMPALIAEWYIGHKGRTNAVSAVRELAPQQSNKWMVIGYLGALGALLINAFYSDVIGWLMHYLVRSMRGIAITDSVVVATQNFNAVATNPVTSIAYQALVFICIGSILWFGVTKGIERAAKILLPCLLLLLVIVVLKGLTMEGAAAAAQFLFKPNFSKLNSQIILAAVGLSFFKLSIGMTTMSAYASYFPEEISLPRTALKMVILDLCVSLLCGMAIFPGVFSSGVEPATGPGLLFVTMPTVFAKIPGGAFFITIFFLLSILATFGAIISISEAAINYLEKLHAFSRRKAVVTVMLISTLLGTLPTLSMTPVLAGFTIWGKNLFDLFDYVSSNLIMPIGGMLSCLFVCYALERQEVYAHLQQSGHDSYAVVATWYHIAKYVTPVVLIVIMLTSL